jgi:hypothetical protein
MPKTTAESVIPKSLGAKAQGRGVNFVHIGARELGSKGDEKAWEQERRGELGSV